MKKCLLPLFILSVFFAGCQKDSNNPDGLPYDIGSRGQIIGYTLKETLDSSALVSEFASLGPLASLATPSYTVSTYLVSYKTINLFDDTVKATGMVIIPHAANNRLPLLSYQHGTIVKKTDVASLSGGIEYTLNLAFSSCDGYVVCMPDYIGMGTGDGLHKYCNPVEEANSIIDLLRAAKKLVEITAQTQLNEQLFLVGYSQGGHATMAAQRDIETKYSAEFSLTASAPMAGPYCLSTTKQFDVMIDSVYYPSPYYLPYIATSLYTSFPGIYSSYSDIFKHPYDSLVPILFDGTHGYEINNKFPDTPSLMIRDDLKLALKADPNHPIRLALSSFDLADDWTPHAPTHLYHCHGDDNVFFENAECAYEKFIARGGNVELYDLGSGTHGDCAPTAFFESRGWFLTLRRIDPK